MPTLGGMAIVCLTACALLAQTAPPPVTLKVEILNSKVDKKSATSSGGMDASNVVVWLTPIGAGGVPAPTPSPARPKPQIAQINKSFDPHVLVVQMGTAVQFPNKDPFLHNV